jgi:long-chain acyl-CoA synthetase
LRETFSFTSLIATTLELLDHGSMNELVGAHSIPAFFAATVAWRGDEPALGSIRGGQLRWWTWREVADDAARLAASIRGKGIQPGERVAQVSENRYEWIIADLAIHLAGAVHVPIHMTLAGEQMAEQIADCGARLVFVSTRELLAKFGDRLDSKVLVFVHDEQARDRADAQLRPAARVPRPAEAPDGSADHAAHGARSRTSAPDELATILYTSGTTGRPRGVMLSQRNLAANAVAMVEAYGDSHAATRLNVLPLSHIYARTCDLYTWVYSGSRLVLGENRDAIGRDFQLARPTALSAVPHLYRRIMEKLQADRPADEAVALRAYFGGRMKRLNCGGAAVAPDVEAWYADHGLPLLPGYGMTEASPVVAVSNLQCRRAGTVGRPLANVEVRLADDGEVLVRGPNVMLGYWQDDAATAEAIRDGWLHTGDLGAIDAGGFLAIRGRKKELIVLATGKKVSPTRIDNLLTASPLIDQVAVFGEGQSALVALVVPSAGGLALDPTTAREQYAAEISRCLASAAHEEQVRHFAILDRPFSVERGEMTAKLSLCRARIAENFAAELGSLHGTRPGGQLNEDPAAGPRTNGRSPLNASQSRR